MPKTAKIIYYYYKGDQPSLLDESLLIPLVMNIFTQNVSLFRFLHMFFSFSLMLACCFFYMHVFEDTDDILYEQMLKKI